MKKSIAIMLTMLMVISLSACGAKEQANANVEQQPQEVIAESQEIVESSVVQESVEPTPIPTPEPTVTPTAEPTLTPEPIVEEDVFTIEDGMEKIDRLLEAHTILLEQNKILENHIQHDTESLVETSTELTQFTTANGEPFSGNSPIFATAINYYNNYVNNNGEYYDFEEWMLTFEDDSDISKTISGFSKKYNTNDVLLLEAIGLIAYMKDSDVLEAAELIETTEYTVSGVQSAYAIDLNCKTEKEFRAVYDEEGNLLNILSNDDWNGYMSSFPNGI